MTIDDYAIQAEDAAEHPILTEIIDVEARPKPSGSQTEDFSPWLVGHDKTVGDQPPETYNKLGDEPQWGSCPRRPRGPRTAREIVEQIKRNSKKA
jgi:hypothetical protein